MRSCIILGGLGASRMASTFESIGGKPFLLIIYPKDYTSFLLNLHFFSSSRIPAVPSRSKTFLKLWSCFTLSTPVINMSSKYPHTLGIPFIKLSMTLWNIAGAEDIPKHSLLY